MFVPTSAIVSKGNHFFTLMHLLYYSKKKCCHLLCLSPTLKNVAESIGSYWLLVLSIKSCEQMGAGQSCAMCVYGHTQLSSGQACLSAPKAS